jgi:hypothetical protein
MQKNMRIQKSYFEQKLLKVYKCPQCFEVCPGRYRAYITRWLVQHHCKNLWQLSK